MAKGYLSKLLDFGDKLVQNSLEDHIVVHIHRLPFLTLKTLFHNLHDEGNTIVLITHDNHVADEAERKICIKDGMVKEVEK